MSDFLSLEFYLTTTSVTSCLILVLVARAHRDIPGPRLWAAGMGFLGLGTFLTFARESLPTSLALPLSNTAIIVGIVVLMVGMQQYCGAPIRWRWSILPILAGVALTCFYSAPNEDFVPRVIIWSVLGSLFAFATALPLIRHAPRDEPLRFLVGAEFLLYSALWILRLVHVALNCVVPLPLSTIDSSLLFLYGAFIVSVALNPSLVLMMSQRLHNRIQAQLQEVDKARAETERALTREQHARKEQHNFLTMVVHEFKAPLGIIVASGDLIALDVETGAQPDTINEEVARIKRAASRLSRMVETTLSDAWLEQTTKASVHTPMSVKDLINEVSADLHQAIRHATETRDLTIHGDPFLLRIALSNMVSNARKFARTPTGVTITTALEPPGDLIIDVTDDGPGISPEDHPFIFDKFYRGMKQKNGQTGTGLGLFLVRRIARLHGGDATLHDQDGQHTTFRLRIPISGRPHVGGDA